MSRAQRTRLMKDWEQSRTLRLKHTQHKQQRSKRRADGPGSMFSCELLLQANIPLRSLGVLLGTHRSFILIGKDAGLVPLSMLSTS